MLRLWCNSTQETPQLDLEGSTTGCTGSEGRHDPKWVWAALLRAALLRVESILELKAVSFTSSATRFYGHAGNCHVVNSVLILANLVGAAVIGSHPW